MHCQGIYIGTESTMTMTFQTKGYGICLLRAIATTNEARMSEMQEMNDSATESTYLKIAAVDRPRTVSLLVSKMSNCGEGGREGLATTF